MASSASRRPLLKHVPNSALFVSEPNPSWFGNGANEPSKANWTNQNWLKSRFHFSFAEYSNYKNSQFGCLRVMNDDLVQPQRGFGQHPHRDAEIMTYVVHGTLVHQDSMGNKGEVQRGGIQYMSAGSGVRHSEHNTGNTPLRFIQCWVTPARRGVNPNYGQFDGSFAERENQVHHVVSSVDNKDADTPIKVHQDVNLFATEFTDSDKSVSITIHPGRMAYLLCVEGAIKLSSEGQSEVKAVKHDAVELQGSDEAQTVTISPVELEEREGNGKSAHFIYFEMQQDAQGGRTDL